MDAAGSASLSSPMPTCTNRNVGSPAALILRLICRLRPSEIEISSQAVGTVLRTCIGGWKGLRAGGARRPITENRARAQGLDLGQIGCPLDLYPIGLPPLVSGAAQLVLKGAVVREQQNSL